MTLDNLTLNNNEVTNVHNFNKCIIRFAKVLKKKQSKRITIYHLEVLS